MMKQGYGRGHVCEYDEQRIVCVSQNKKDVVMQLPMEMSNVTMVIKQMEMDVLSFVQLNHLVRLLQQERHDVVMQ